MAQDFIIVNHDAREYLEPNCFGEGSQWGQVARGDFGSMFALAYLLSTDRDPKHPWMGAWIGHRIALVGDYSTESEIMFEPDGAAEPRYKDVSFVVILDLLQARSDFQEAFAKRLRERHLITMDVVPDAIKRQLGRIT